ncbi:MAG TPA: hypothetical protein VLM85_28050 [Polyangiaceae bacterium]|nr:hypothetical protein [Polyangiaceae bacterium]
MSSLRSSLAPWLRAGAAAVTLTACASGGSARFALRDPLWRDTDLRPVDARCHVEPTKSDPHHVSCAPAVYESPVYWDGADNLLFRPLSGLLGLVTSGEAVDVNSLDEVPDSAWFENRLGKRSLSPEELRLGGCSPDQLLDPEHAADASWVIDKGKSEGSTPGFRVLVPGKGKYMLKGDAPKDRQPERMAAASAIGAAVMHAAGYYVSCEQVIYIRPSILKLTPGLTTKGYFEEEKPFDQSALDRMLARATKRNGLIRLSASAWLPGYAIGPYRFEGVREDDPNDVIPHEDRRELRAMKVLASWLSRHDVREDNSLDEWFAEAKTPPDSSPGHVVHYQLDTSETLGSLSFGGGSDPVPTWSWDQVSRRLGMSYVIDWADLGRDFITLGLPLRSWDTVAMTPGQEIFGYFDVEHFVPDQWKCLYPNAAFSRMTERDAAWMARILARFTPAMVRTLAAMGDFTDPSHRDYLAGVLEGRLEKVLERYLLRLSPLADVHVEDGDRLCALDLAEWRGLRAPFYDSARTPAGASLTVTRRNRGGLCVQLVHVAGDAGSPDDAPERYLRVIVEDGVAKGALVAHLYDLGPARGFRLVGLERPNP